VLLAFDMAIGIPIAGLKNVRSQSPKQQHCVQSGLLSITPASSTPNQFELRFAQWKALQGGGVVFAALSHGGYADISSDPC